MVERNFKSSQEKKLFSVLIETSLEVTVAWDSYCLLKGTWFYLYAHTHIYLYKIISCLF